MLSLFFRTVLRARGWYFRRRNQRLRQEYAASGLRLGSVGYPEYKEAELARAVADDALLAAFGRNAPLSDSYGTGLDERIVEYPWALSRLAEGRMRLMDAGSTLNFNWIATSPVMRDKEVVVCTLAPEGVLSRASYSYLYGDLRRTILRDECFEAVVCISTLEHIGMDNTLYYTDEERFREFAPRAYRDALREMYRVLVPGGKLLLTVPFGRYENLGWMQQFDAALLDDAIGTFGGEVRDLSYFRYTDTGWCRASAEECTECAYLYRHDRVEGSAFGAARAVACVELLRP